MKGKEPLGCVEVIIVGPGPILKAVGAAPSLSKDLILCKSRASAVKYPRTKKILKTQSLWEISSFKLNKQDQRSHKRPLSWQVATRVTF